MLSDMTVDTTKVALVFAGQGESHFANTAELLNDYFGIEGDLNDTYDGDEVEFGAVYFVLTEEQPSTGLNSLFDWADWLGLDYSLVVPEKYKETRYSKSYFKYASEIIDERVIGDFVSDINTGLEPLFVFAWGDEPVDADFDLLEAAMHDDYKALDVTAGLDDLILEPDESEKEPEPEPEPEPEEKPKRSTRSRKPKTEPEPEPEDADEGVEEDAAAMAIDPTGGPNVETRPFTPEETAALDAAEKSLDALERGEATARVVMKRVNKANFLAAFENMHVVVKAFVDALPDDMEFELDVPVIIPGGGSTVEVAEPEKPKRGRGRPRNPNPKPVKEYRTDEGDWVRAGRGRPPAGVEIRWVNPETGEEVDPPK